MIRVKRVYEPRERGDGRRILVERLWPRGLKKEALAADEWLKEVAPSTALRKWFDHQVERWPEFVRRYRDELDANTVAWQPILDASRRRTVTLLFSARDPLHNGAVVLRDYLAERQRRPAGTRSRLRKGRGRSVGKSKARAPTTPAARASSGRRKSSGARGRDRSRERTR
jgi:uncharacterized protein YeaO (DUF488 family)